MNQLRKLLGLFKAAWLWRFRAEALDAVFEQFMVANLRRRPEHAKKFVLYVGFSKSGKTTHLRKSFRRHYATIDTVDIHMALNQALVELQDGFAVDGRSYWTRQILARWMREKLIRMLCKYGLTIVQDSCNLVRAERQRLMSIPRQHGYTTTIIHVTCPEATLLKRLERADADNAARGEEATWVRLYRDVQRPRYEPPLRTEADELTEIRTLW